MMIYRDQLLQTLEVRCEKLAHILDDKSLDETEKNKMFASAVMNTMMARGVGIIKFAKELGIKATDVSAWAKKDRFPGLSEQKRIQRRLLELVQNHRKKIRDELDELNFKVEGNWEFYERGFILDRGVVKFFVFKEGGDKWSALKQEHDGFIQQIGQYDSHLEAAKALV